MRSGGLADRVLEAGPWAGIKRGGDPMNTH